MSWMKSNVQFLYRLYKIKNKKLVITHMKHLKSYKNKTRKLFSQMKNYTKS